MTIIGWVTLNVGEQGVIYSHEGAAREVKGPQRIFLWREKFIKLEKCSANQTEYLIIKHRNGSISHRPGPCVVYLNPVLHDTIRTEPAVQLSASEAIVVYRLSRATGGVDRRLVFGPTQFIPQENEWLHTFKWHGVDPENKTRFIPGLHVSSVLETVPNQFYYNVDMVRTADGGLLRVKLMVFYSLKDIELMLTTTQDPIADIIHCIASDVTTFAASRSYLEFANDSNKLNDVTTYRQLTQRVKGIGFEVSKIVFRGYFVAPAIQQMHDKATEKRANLKFKFEKEKQAQEFIDQELDAQQQTLRVKHSTALQQLVHKTALERSAKEHELKIKEAEQMAKIKQKKESTLNGLRILHTSNTQKVAYYTKLQSLGVDLTQYIISGSTRPAKVTEIVSSTDKNVVHLHYNE